LVLVDEKASKWAKVPTEAAIVAAMKFRLFILVWFSFLNIKNSDENVGVQKLKFHKANIN